MSKPIFVALFMISVIGFGIISDNERAEELHEKNVECTLFD
jgi:hypothetical protein